MTHFMITLLALALAAPPVPADESAYSAAKQIWAACLAEKVDTFDTPIEPVDAVVLAAFGECAAQEKGLRSAMMSHNKGTAPEVWQAATLAHLKASNREWLTGIVLRVRQMNERAKELHPR